MPDDLPPDLVVLRDRAERLAREVLVPVRDAAGPGSADRVRQVRDASRQAGIHPLAQPAEFGGGATLLALTVVRDTLGAHNVCHLPGIFGPGPGVLAGVGEPLRSRYLLPLLAGEKRAAFAFTEPDDAERATWGVLDGDTLTVNGRKSYVTGGASADFLNVLVEIEEHGPAMVVVDRNAAGVHVRRTFGSADGSHHAHIEFRAVALPRTHIVGEPGRGLTRAMRQIGDTRLALAAEGVGLCRWVIDFVTDHITGPHRSGAPLATREGVRLRYADMRILAYAARSMVYRTARLGDAGENIVNEGIAAKVFATEAVGEVVDAGIQLVGGAALRRGHPLEELYRRVRALRLAEGSSDVLRLNLARGRLDLSKGRI